MPTKKLQFKVKVEGKEAGVVAAITPPVDVPEFFGTRARIPIRGTINGFPFRSSLMPMGGCHMMPVNKTLREGAGVKPGDTVEVVMERDGEERTVEAPPLLKKELARNKKARENGRRFPSRTRRRWRFHFAMPSRKKPVRGAWPRSCRFSPRARSGPVKSAELAVCSRLQQCRSPETTGCRRCRLLRRSGRLERSPE